MVTRRFADSDCLPGADELCRPLRIPGKWNLEPVQFRNREHRVKNVNDALGLAGARKFAINLDAVG